MATEGLPLPRLAKLSIADTGDALPCIHCGQCDDVCPVAISPQRLLQAILLDRLQTASVDGLFDCTRCGRCDPVCPSRIPLLAQFDTAQTALKADTIATAFADAARERYLARQKRLVSELGERRERAVEQVAHAASADAVAAAIERANARRRARQQDPQ